MNLLNKVVRITGKLVGPFRSLGGPAALHRLFWGAETVCLLLGATLVSMAQAGPKGSTSVEDQAREAFAAKDYRQAEELFVKAIGGDPTAHAPAQLMEAKCQVNLAEYARAEQTLHSYLRLEPRSAQALYLLGFVLQRENQPRASLEAFNRAAAIETPLPNDLKLVGLDYVLLNDYGDAIRWLQRSVAGDPKNAEAWYALGRAQMHQGHFDESIAAFQHVLAVTPGDVKALDNLGLSYEAQNKPEEALKAYAAAVEANNGKVRPSEQPLLDYGALLNSRQQFGQAVPVLRRATEIAPGSSRCFEELARGYAGAGQNEPARQAMERALALDPKNPRLHFQLGRIYRNLGLKEKAEAEFGRSSALYGTRSSSPEP